MEIYENEMGWTDSQGNQIAYNEKWAFMNTCRAEQHKRPIWKDSSQNTSSKTYSTNKEKEDESKK